MFLCGGDFSGFFQTFFSGGIFLPRSWLNMGVSCLLLLLLNSAFYCIDYISSILLLCPFYHTLIPAEPLPTLQFTSVCFRAATSTSTNSRARWKCCHARSAMRDQRNMSSTAVSFDPPQK